MGRREPRASHLDGSYDVRTCADHAIVGGLPRTSFQTFCSFVLIKFLSYHSGSCRCCCFNVLLISSILVVVSCFVCLYLNCLICVRLSLAMKRWVCFGFLSITVYCASGSAQILITYDFLYNTYLPINYFMFLITVSDVAADNDKLTIYIFYYLQSCQKNQLYYTISC